VVLVAGVRVRGRKVSVCSQARVLTGFLTTTLCSFDSWEGAREGIGVLSDTCTQHEIFSVTIKS